MTYPPMRSWVLGLMMIARYLALAGFILLPGKPAAMHGHASVAAPVIFDFDCIDGEPGDTVCIPIRVQDFTDIVIAQFEIIWDSNILDYLNVRNPGTPSINVLADFNQSGPNALKFIPLGFPIDGESLPDGSILFEVCFRIIGTPGSTSPIGISPFFDFEVADINGVVPANFTPCTVTVENAVNLAGFVSSCGPAFPGGNGSIDISAFGGMPPYTITWIETGSGVSGGPASIPVAGGNSILNVPAGLYNITLTDAAGASQVYTIEVDPLGLTAMTTLKRPTCYKFANGTITLKPRGGSSPFSYLWQGVTHPELAGSGFIRNPGDSSLITSLPDGIYTFILRDDNGCEVTITDTLADNPFVFTVVNQQDARCKGSQDGFIDLQISGATPSGSGDYLITVRPGFQVNSNSIAVGLLNPGQHCITVSDAVSQCDTVFCFTIGYTDTISAILTTRDVSCFGGNNGRVTIRGRTNGLPAPTYSYSIFNANNALVTFQPNVGGNFNYSPLRAGTYSVLIEENGCRSDTFSFTINEPPPINISLVGTNPDNCIATGSGDAWFSISGAALPYTIDCGAGFDDADTIFNLGTGNYVLTVTDANLCTATLPFRIDDYAVNEEADITFTFNGVPCEGGTVTVLYQGAPIPPGFGVQWSTGEITPTITLSETDTLSVDLILGAPIFCILTDTVQVRCQDVLLLDIVVQQPLCGNNALGGPFTGTVIVDTINAVPPVTWYWSVPDTTTTGIYAGLAPGKYYVTVTDGLDSTAVDSFEIIAPASLAMAFTNAMSTSCRDTCDGSVRVIPSGGDPGIPYSLFWNSGTPMTSMGATFTVKDLCAGPVPFSISQDGICFYADTVDIPAPDPLLLLVDAVNPSCFGFSDGRIEVGAFGGAGAYSYAWSNAVSGGINAGIPAGTYALTVTDAVGCSREDTFEIIQPDSLVAGIDLALTLPLSCGGSNDGVIVVSATGGNPGPYTYTWSPNVSTSFQAANLSQGLYRITVTDAKGCTDTTGYILSAPTPILVDWQPVPSPECFGDETVILLGPVTGGSGNYSFNINGGPLMTITEPVIVPSGIYVVNVFDNRGCSVDTTYTIIEPNPIIVSITPENPIVDLGDSLLLTGEIIQSDNPVVLYSWTSAEPLSCPGCISTWVYNDAPAVYTWTVTDANGCQGSADILVNVDYARDVYIPNVFSPNDDGRNDDFKVFTGLGVVSIERIEIYDRWGNLLHAEKDLLPNPTGAGKWNGMSNGQPLGPGVYVYTVRVRFVDNNTVLTYRGDVTLLR